MELASGIDVELAITRNDELAGQHHAVSSSLRIPPSFWGFLGDFSQPTSGVDEGAIAEGVTGSADWVWLWGGLVVGGGSRAGADRGEERALQMLQGRPFNNNWRSPDFSALLVRTGPECC
jgi:hypothetical protein